MYGSLGKNSKGNDGSTTGPPNAANGPRLHMRSTGPPANFVQEMTPEKEEENRSSRPPPDSNSVSYGYRHSWDSPKKDHQQQQTMGTTDGVFSADNRFKSNDAEGFPLLNGNVNGIDKLLDRMTFKKSNNAGVGSSAMDGSSRSNSTTTNNSTTTSTTADTVTQDGKSSSYALMNYNNNSEVDMESRYVGSVDNPAFEPNGGRAPYNLDFLTQPISQQHPGNTNIEENITKNSIFGPNRSKPIMTTTTNNTGTNTMSTGGGGGENLYMLNSGQRQGFWNVDGTTQVPWLNMANINNDNQRYQQQVLLQGNEQPYDKNKEKKKRKHHHIKNQGQIINPRNLPGWVGDQEVDDIMKIFDFEQDKGKRNNKSKSPENGGTSSGKKANNKSQKQPQQSKQHEQGVHNNDSPKKRQQSRQSSFGQNRQVSSASPGAIGDEKEAADVEEMDVDIQLDNDAGQAQQQEEEKPQQQEQDEQTEVERKPSPKWFVAGTKTKKAPWCSSSLAAKKEQWRHIRDTPLLDRINRNVMAQLKWKQPITLIMPPRPSGNQHEKHRKLDAIWNGPANLEAVPARS